MTTSAPRPLVRSRTEAHARRRGRARVDDVADVLGADPSSPPRGARAARRRRRRGARPKAARRSPRSSPRGRCPARRPCRPARSRRARRHESPVGRPQPPPMKSSAVDTVGQRHEVDARAGSRSARPSRRAGRPRRGRDAVDPRCGQRVAAFATRQCQQAPQVPNTSKNVTRRAGLDRLSLDVRERAARLEHAPAVHVARDDRVGHARQAGRGAGERRCRRPRSRPSRGRHRPAARAAPARRRISSGWPARIKTAATVAVMRVALAGAWRGAETGAIPSTMPERSR